MKFKEQKTCSLSVLEEKLLEHEEFLNCPRTLTSILRHIILSTHIPNNPILQRIIPRGIILMLFTSLSRFEHYYRRVIKSGLRIRVLRQFSSSPNCNTAIQDNCAILLHLDFWTHILIITIA